MEIESRSWTLGELAALFGGELVGPAELKITHATTADTHDPHGLTFAEDARFLASALASGVGAVIAATGADTQDKPAILVDRPRQIFGLFLSMCVRPLPLGADIHPTAVVSPDAQVDPTARIGAYAVVERGAKIGAGSRVYAHSYVGENCQIGEGCTLYPHVVLYQDIVLGNRVTVHAGTVLGADGFGYYWDGQRQAKVPQTGGVILADDVEIGANTTVDRATAGMTRVDEGVKIDNLVQIAHNCRIGRDSIIASFVGVSGSTILGKRNVLAGKVDTRGHLKTADDAIFGGRTAITGDIDKPGEYLGFPAQPVMEAKRNILLASRLQDLFARLRTLEKKVAAQEAEK